MPFFNRIRLPLYLKTPQFPTEANRFRLSNGESKTLSVTIRKNYSAVTDYMSQTMHQRLVIALNHDNVSIEGDRYVGGVTVDGEYEITWPDFLDYPLGQAAVKIQVTPFDMTNDNCKTCDEMTQLALVDDNIGELAEGATGVINVYSNDSICCFPIVSEITYFNTAYLVSAAIDANGNVTLVVKNPADTVGSIVMATYRVTCPDGTYDEADVYASIAGSGAACEQPSAFDLVAITIGPPISADIEWAAPVADPANGYEWILYKTADLGTPVDSGTSLDKTVTVTNLDGSTAYTFSVRSVCEEGVYSLYSSIGFTTPASGIEDCGTFDLSADDGTVDPNYIHFSYMDCNGIIASSNMLNLTERTVCMLMDAFNTPVYFEVSGAGDEITYLYDGPC